MNFSFQDSDGDDEQPIHLWGKAFQHLKRDSPRCRPKTAQILRVNTPHQPQKHIVHSHSVPKPICEHCHQVKESNHDCHSEYEEIPCPYCPDRIIRAFLKDHLEECVGYIEHQFREISTEQECVICFLQITDKSTELPCRHSFHSECIGDWFKKKKECPVCRGQN